MTLLRGNFKETVRIREVATSWHTQGVELLLKVVSLRVWSKPLKKELEELSSRCTLQKPITLMLFAKGKHQPSKVLFDRRVIRIDRSVYVPKPQRRVSGSIVQWELLG